MIVGEAKPTRCVMGRLEKGEPVVQGLVDLAAFERIDAGFVRAQGVLEDPELRLYNPWARGYLPAGLGGALLGTWELVSLDGNVSLDAGAPVARVWAVLAAERGGAPQLVAGLLTGGTAVFVEFAVDVYDDGDLERRDDPVTGVRLWRPPRRR